MSERKLSEAGSSKVPVPPASFRMSKWPEEQLDDLLMNCSYAQFASRMAYNVCPLANSSAAD